MSVDMTETRVLLVSVTKKGKTIVNLKILLSIVICITRRWQVARPGTCLDDSFKHFLYRTEQVESRPRQLNLQHPQKRRELAQPDILNKTSITDRVLIVYPDVPSHEKMYKRWQTNDGPALKFFAQRAKEREIASIYGRMNQAQNLSQSCSLSYRANILRTY
jgi:hypothetical protein